MTLTTFSLEKTLDFQAKINRDLQLEILITDLK